MISELNMRENIDNLSEETIRKAKDLLEKLLTFVREYEGFKDEKEAKRNGVDLTGKKQLGVFEFSEQVIKMSNQYYELIPHQDGYGEDIAVTPLYQSSQVMNQLSFVSRVMSIKSVIDIMKGALYN